MLNRKNIAALILGALVFGSIPALGRVAVFPLQDLSIGANGVNFEITDFLSARLAENGIETVSQQAVISFMARHRIRVLGHLETFHITQAAEDLGARFILLGTINQSKETPGPAIGVALSLVRTEDALTIWSYVADLSSADLRKILEIAQPRTVADLLPLLCDDIVSRWPRNFTGIIPQAVAVSIDAVQLHPTHLRPGEQVNCSVRLRPLWSPGQEPRVYFKVGSRIHSAVLAENHTYEAFWAAEDQDGRFPVILVLQWPSARQETVLLGSYFVDGEPPRLSLNLRGTSLHGTPAFRDQLLILPRLEIRKPIARWHIFFLDENGEVLLDEQGSGKLPERFLWRGQRASGGLVGEGEYQVLLKIWDLAGNPATASHQVMVNRAPPDVMVAASHQGQELMVDLRHEGKVPLAFWRMEMRADDGELLKLVEGSDLPARVEMPLAGAIGNRRVEAVVVMKDVLGNESRREFKDLALLARQQEKEQSGGEEPAAATKAWVEEF